MYTLEYLRCSYTKTQMVNTLDSCHSHSSPSKSPQPSCNPAPAFRKCHCFISSFWGEENQFVGGRTGPCSQPSSSCLPVLEPRFPVVSVCTTSSLSSPLYFEIVAIITHRSPTRPQAPHGSVLVPLCPRGAH